MKLLAIAQTLHVDFVGDGSVEIEKPAPLAVADGASISFLRDRSRTNLLATSKAGAVIVPVGVEVDRPAIYAENPEALFAQVLLLFDASPKPTPGIHGSAVIGEGGQIGDNVSIGPKAVIGNHVTLGDNVIIGAGAVIDDGVILGEDCRVYPNAVIYYGVQIGARAIIHSNAVIGADGFGFKPGPDGAFYKIPQIGTVIMGNDVEVGACSSIDRATMGATLIGDGVKIDNQVQIAHNVVIGKNCVIAGCCGISGSVTIGNNCVLGGNATVGDNIAICSGTIIGGMSAVISDITEPGVYSGIYARKHMDNKRFQLSGKRLDKLEKRVKTIENRVEDHS
jgi:UDP-3-O-[3-hydroxymyristoyl] glucosamine N-acyltransferase